MRCPLCLLVAALVLMAPGCAREAEEFAPVPPPSQEPRVKPTPEIYNQEDGCDGPDYPPLAETPYVLPYPPGFSYPTGLTNCSSSYHGPRRPDAYAFDFDMPEGSDFTCIRDGKVCKVVNNETSFGLDGTSGNYVIVDHGDRTFALYLHSPKNGIEVSEGQQVRQGQVLGITGRSGLAGYPHLHLIVVKDGYTYPYEGIPLSFKNVSPRHVVLKSKFQAGYLARPY